MTDTDIRANATRPLVAAGLWPPWKVTAGQARDESTPSEADVVHDWREVATGRKLESWQVRAAVRSWLDKPTIDTRRWPNPADVLEHAPAQPTAGTIPGCGRCDELGGRTVAIHRSGDAGVDVGVFATLCDCGRGEHYQRHRTQPLKGCEGEPRPEPPRLADVVAGAWTKPGTLGVYPDPTVEQLAPLGSKHPRLWRDTPAPVREAFVRQVSEGYNHQRRDAPPPVSTRRLRDEADRAVKARGGLPPTEPREVFEGSADGDADSSPWETEA